MGGRSNYDKCPVVPVGTEEECSVGWQAIVATLRSDWQQHRAVCVECYPGVLIDQLLEGLRDHLPCARYFSPRVA